MSPRTKTRLQQKYPDQWWLGVDEVAKELGKATKGCKNVIRARMKDGTYPGAQKHIGRWKLPLEELAEILEPSPSARPPVIPHHVITGVAGGKKQQAQLGPLIAAIRSAGFWSRVAEALGWEQEAQLLDKAARDMLQALVDEAARAQATRFGSGFAPATKPSGGRGPGNTI
ncbi:hypothetical protein [Xanthomonas sp. NCPPB 2632]|uniref:hypothetical protein n=1 Tax=Xanthomonas sp. NCPPB 2632 TaxID=3240912 RepID=UPI0035168D84